MNVLFVGGGKASVILIHLFQGHSELNIVGVVDPNLNAPGIQLARKLRTGCFRSIKEACQVVRFDLVVEVTGNTKVREEIYRNIGGDVDLLTAGGAQVMDQILNMQKQKQNGSVSNDLSRIGEQLHTVVGGINKLSEDIENLMREFELLSINASIEAARAGEMGRGFSVVAERIMTVSKHVKTSVGTISQSSAEGSRILESMKSIRERLT